MIIRSFHEFGVSRRPVRPVCPPQTRDITSLCVRRTGHRALGNGRCLPGVTWLIAFALAGAGLADGHLCEQVFAADLLAVGDRELIDSREGMVDHAGHGAEARSGER